MPEINSNIKPCETCLRCIQDIYGFACFDTNTCRSGAMLVYKFYPLHNLCFILSCETH